MLKMTEEGQQRTIFGGYFLSIILIICSYSVKIVKEANIVLQMYKKDNLYLAEIGKKIAQKLGFDM